MFNPYFLVTLLAIYGIWLGIRTIMKREVKLSNALNLTEYEITLTGRSAVIFSSLFIVGNIILIIATTVFNPFYDFVPEYVFLFSCLTGLFFYLVAIIIGLKLRD